MSNVFISSTGIDLADYREAAIEICNMTGMVPIAMEYFEAMGVGATEGSKLQLDNADLYIGIFAHRYGYIEKGQEKSVTEIEFDYAGKRGFERLCFLVKLDYPWPPDLIDYKNYALLHALKNKIDAAVIRNEFTTVDDFRAKLMHALVVWQKKQEKNSGKFFSTPSSIIVFSDAPPRPTLFIGRDNVMNDMKIRLGIFDQGERKRLNIIRGLLGVGKTTLVKALMYDKDIKQNFPDGILWASLGENANPSTALQSWMRQIPLLEGWSTSTDLKRLMTEGRNFFRNKQFLLIADDVWEDNHATPCKQIVGDNCALIITTRFNNLARSLSDIPKEDIYTLDVLSIDKSLEMLTRVAPFVVQNYPAECKLLIKDLEGLPLFIRVAGRLLADEADLGINVSSLLSELRESNRLVNEVAPDDRFDPKTGLTPTIDLLLKRSTDRLDKISRDRFGKLGAFAPKPATFDQAAMSKIFFWGGVTDPVPTIRKLVDRGLLEPIITQGVYQMHNVLVMHAKSIYKH
jgi:hypothetical protein